MDDKRLQGKRGNEEAGLRERKADYIMLCVRKGDKFDAIIMGRLFSYMPSWFRAFFFVGETPPRSLSNGNPGMHSRAVLSHMLNQVIDAGVHHFHERARI